VLRAPLSRMTAEADSRFYSRITGQRRGAWLVSFRRCGPEEMPSTNGIDRCLGNLESIIRTHQQYQTNHQKPGPQAAPFPVHHFFRPCFRCCFRVAEVSNRLVLPPYPLSLSHVASHSSLPLSAAFSPARHGCNNRAIQAPRSLPGIAGEMLSGSAVRPGERGPQHGRENIPTVVRIRNRERQLAGARAFPSGAPRRAPIRPSTARRNRDFAAFIFWSPRTSTARA